jgi:hypothetical protein
MRFLYGSIGVIGGALSLAATYLFFIFSMFMGGEQGALGKGPFYATLMFLLAALLNLVAGFMDPHKRAPRLLLLSSACLWVLGALFLGGLGYVMHSDKNLLDGVKFVAVVSAPALLPLAAWAVAQWKFRQT